MKHLTFVVCCITFFACNDQKPESKQTLPAQKTIVIKDSLVSHEQEKEDDNRNFFDEQTPQKENLKKLLKFKEDIEEFIEWNDSTGYHVVVTTDAHTQSTNVKLKAIHYVQPLDSSSFKKVWTVSESTGLCEFDSDANFKKNVLQTTDLDNNGIPEIWLMYYIYCKSDVSSSELTLLMFEGTCKYKMTGETKMFIGDGQYIGGEIKDVGDFKNQTKWLAFAKKLWKANCLEVFGE